MLKSNNDIQELYQNVNDEIKNKTIRFKYYNSKFPLDLVQVCLNEVTNTIDISFRNIFEENIEELSKLNKEIEKKLKNLEEYKVNSQADFKEWQYEYNTRKIIPLFNELTKKEKDILLKLGIDIKNNILYSEGDFDRLRDQELLSYLHDDDMTEEELRLQKDLENTGVNEEDYNELIKKFELIENKYQDKFIKLNLKN